MLSMYEEVNKFLPSNTFTHNIMDGFVEGVIFREDKKDDERHIDVVWGAVGGMVEGVKDGQDEALYVSAGEDIGAEVIIFM